MSQEERIAENEAWYRSLNERKAEWVKDGLTAAGFRCECWRTDCGERIQLSNRQWEEVRSRPTRFVVLPGHVATDIEGTDVEGTAVEEVVKEYPHFWIIEKCGEAGDEAAKRE